MDATTEVKPSNLKPVPKFNVGHFPPGTVVTVECNFERYLDDHTEREYEGQMYGLIRDITVISTSCNGPGSYVLEFDTPARSSMLKGNHVCHLDWVRSIQLRGKDSCSPVPFVETGDLVGSLVFREDTSGIHAYDIDSIRNIVYNANKIKPLSKRRLRKLVKRVMSHHRIQLKVTIKQEREFWDSMYEDVDDHHIF